MDDGYRVLDSLSEKKGQGGGKKIRVAPRKPEPQPINSDIIRNHDLEEAQCLDLSTCEVAKNDARCSQPGHHLQRISDCCMFYHALGTNGGSESDLKPSGCPPDIWKYDDRYYEGRESW
jgi:hypothetical protein